MQGAGRVKVKINIEDVSTEKKSEKINYEQIHY